MFAKEKKTGAHLQKKKKIEIHLLFQGLNCLRCKILLREKVNVS